MHTMMVDDQHSTLFHNGYVDESQPHARLARKSSHQSARCQVSILEWGIKGGSLSCWTKRCCKIRKRTSCL